MEHDVDRTAHLDSFLPMLRYKQEIKLLFLFYFHISVK